MASCFWVALLLIYVAQAVDATPWSWRAAQQSVNTPTEYQHAIDQTPQIFTAALEDLQSLESQPLCHRTAALFLIDDCQILNGKDEASVLTDAGPQIRDFVDSYAASLAICDLERGSFVIPPACDKFREAELAKAATTHGRHRIHATAAEIGACLTGLSKLDSTWNTWVSYRHKALRFCEVARRENEKDVAWEKLEKLEQTISSKITDDIQRSSAGLTEILEQAAAIQQFFVSLENQTHRQMKDVVEQGTKAVLHMSSHAKDGVATVDALLEPSLNLAMQLAQQIHRSSNRIAEVEKRQEALEEGMKRLVAVTTDLAVQNNAQIAGLANASRHTSQIVESLENAALAVSTLQEVSLALSRDAYQSDSRRGLFNMWPLAICPSAILILGSYGLQPSMVRNLGLLALGEVLGGAIWVAQTGTNGKKQRFESMLAEMLGNKSDWAKASNDKSENVPTLVSEELRVRKRRAHQDTGAKPVKDGQYQEQKETSEKGDES
ncbi:hypothetical protein TD95_000945 [Thielaviopsis punctulata]|uniref:Nuclear fusion protein KAR5 n=1 Tax=Thielaviopsis punctulata TaxID=72032 RepID=A0A0F4ZG91_9PEZI|nr:hypothetical protein TD95_000945 [Thielaviopsis punctulata]